MVPGNATDANVTSYRNHMDDFTHGRKGFEHSIVASNVGAKKDVYSEKLSYRVLYFASPWSAFSWNIRSDYKYRILVWYIAWYDMISVYGTLEVFGEF